MASTLNHGIVIQTADRDGDVTRRESLAAAAITPGELLQFDSATTVNAHSVVAGVLQGKIVALETQTPDDETNPTIDVDYDAADTVYYVEARPGDILNMWLAAGETTVMNPPSQLQSDAAGALAVVAVGAGTLANSIVGVADEALVAGVARARCRVRIV